MSVELESQNARAFLVAVITSLGDRHHDDCFRAALAAAAAAAAALLARPYKSVSRP
jgi:hypothetical protein